MSVKARSATAEASGLGSRSRYGVMLNVVLVAPPSPEDAAFKR